MRAASRSRALGSQWGVWRRHGAYWAFSCPRPTKNTYATSVRSTFMAVVSSLALFSLSFRCFATVPLGAPVSSLTAPTGFESPTVRRQNQYLRRRAALEFGCHHTLFAAGPMARRCVRQPWRATVRVGTTPRVGLFERFPTHVWPIARDAAVTVPPINAGTPSAIGSFRPIE